MHAPHLDIAYEMGRADAVRDMLRNIERMDMEGVPLETIIRYYQARANHAVCPVCLQPCDIARPKVEHCERCNVAYDVTDGTTKRCPTCHGALSS
jgi:hypothetical protein